MYRHHINGIERIATGSIIPLDPANRDYQEYLVWAESNPTPSAVAPQITADHVRSEARRRILARFPDWKQTNMTARGVEIQDVWRRLGEWTAEEQAEADALTAAWDWIKLVRAASNAMEPNPPADYKSDSRWPQ